MTSGAPRGRWRQALDDIRERRYLEAYGGFVIALAVVVINLVGGYLTNQGFVPTLVGSATILLLGVLALGSAELRRSVVVAATERSSVWRFFSDRTTLPPLNERFTGARVVYIIGLQLNEIVSDALPDLADRAAQGCKIRVAVFSPVNPEGDRSTLVDAIDAVHELPNLEGQLHANIATLLAWWGKLKPSHRKNVDVRAYFQLPTAAIMLVNPGTRTAEVHVDPMLYKMEPARRPAFWVRASSDPLLTERLTAQYVKLFENATPLSDLKGVNGRSE